MHDYKQLKVWQKSMELVKDIYNVINKFPDFEKYALGSQMRRSVISIPSNIAEGAGRNSQNEFRLFLGYTNGSCYELETQLLIAKDQDYLDESRYNEIIFKINEIQKMNFKLIKSIK
ncbi:MAG: four helix bundle protein [Chitinophagales bacterium]